jgi:hypothetical protein
MRKYILSLLLLFPMIVFADEFNNPKISNPAPAVGTTAWDFIALIIQILMWFVIPAITITLIYTGYLFATASGDPAKIKTAKGYLFGSIIGAVVVFSAQMIVNVVKTTGENILN